jgi:hypothetical protein
MILCLSSSAHAESVRFDDKDFELKFATNATLSNGYIKEYIPKNQNLNKWEEMISIHTFPKVSDPKQFAQYLGDIVNKKYGAKFYLIINQKENMAVLSFILPSNDKNLPFLEYNLWKYKKHNNGGIIGLQYAKRFYIKKNTNLKLIGVEFSKKHPILVNKIIKMPYPKL